MVINYFHSINNCVFHAVNFFPHWLFEYGMIVLQLHGFSILLFLVKKELKTKSSTQTVTAFTLNAEKQFPIFTNDGKC